MLLRTKYLILFMAALGPLFLPGGAAIAECNGTCVEGKTCQGATSQTPAAHVGTHTCGGTYTNDLVEGTCVTGFPDDDCTLRETSINVNQYQCSGGMMGCNHTLLGTIGVQGCNC